MRARPLRRGAAAIEFALWLPLLFLLISIVIDWGSFMTTRVAVSRAAMDGARNGAATFEPAAAAPGSVAGPKGVVRARGVLNGMGYSCPAGPGCVVTAEYCPGGAPGPCDCAAPGCIPPIDMLRVEVDYAYTPFFGWAFTPNRVRADFVMAMESQR